MLRNHLALAILTALPLATACSSSVDVADDLAGDAGSEIAGKADAPTADTFTYFAIRADFRKCGAPLCGGYFVSRVNSASTTCADGRHAPFCYVATLDTSGLGLSDRDLAPLRERVRQDGSVLVRGAIRQARYGNANLGRFDATEAWLAGAAAGAADGIGVKARPNGIRCFAAPCADTHEAKLNATTSAEIAGLNFGPSGATDDEIAQANDALTGGGLIVFGDRYTVRANRQSAKGRTVTQFYTRLQAAADGCHVGGCSGQLCTDRPDLVSTCEWRAEYACYQDATCERQVSGACGWTATTELQACLADASSPLVTAAQCQAQGGLVRWDVGDGSTRCAAGERELGRVTGGDEGGRCCSAP